MKKVLIYIGGGMLIAWGVAHIIPVAGVVAGFGPISPDNARVHFRADFLPHKLCPFIFTTAGLMILQGVRQEKAKKMKGRR